MKISFNLLKEFVDFNLSAIEVSKHLTMRGIEVEGIDNIGEKYNNFVIGKVLKVEQHPNADKLSLCEVDVKGGVLKIVCGAKNVASNQFVVVGKIGAVVPHNQHDDNEKPFELKRVKIRGEESNGMICSEYELGIGKDRDGILVLKNVDEKNIGENFSNFFGLNDIILDISLTPNRGDCLSHIGIAREIASIINSKTKNISIKLKEDKSFTKDFLNVEIKNTENCFRYVAKIVLDIEIKPSPTWLKNKVEQLGFRSINNIVDATNYTMAKFGQPLHVFDYDKIDGKKIIVQLAKENENFISLDDKERKLNSSTLLICDAKKPIALAGIMGGKNSEITNATKNIVIESAYFFSENIRKTSKYLSLNSDASQRFERGVDISQIEFTANYCTNLIHQIANGKILNGSIDIYLNKIENKKISLRTSYTNKILGTNFSSSQIQKFLSSIAICKLKKISNDEIEYKIPSFRQDIFQEIDLVEEVARVLGYDNIETNFSTNLKFPDTIESISIDDKLRNYLSNTYFEIVSNSMQEKKISQISSEKLISILNPINQEMSSLRTSLIPSMLSIVRHNIFNGNKNLRLFEIGKTYFYIENKEDSLSLKNFNEESHLLLLLSGNKNLLNWETAEKCVDIFDLKGEVENLFEKVFRKKIYFEEVENEIFFSDCLKIYFEKNFIGICGTANSKILKQFEIEQDVFIVDINVDLLENFSIKIPKYKTLSKFPSVYRDFAFIMDDKNQKIGEIEKFLFNANSLIRSVILFDIYKGKEIGDGKQSCAFRLEFRSTENTLTDEIVDSHCKKILDEMNKKFNVYIRI